MPDPEWLTSFLVRAEDQARRRGDRIFTCDHLALAMSHPGSDGTRLLWDLGVDPTDWRDQVIRVLGWRESAVAAREGRPAVVVADSMADLWYRGRLDTDGTVDHVVRLSRQEAEANGSTVGPAHLLVGLLLEGNGIGAATARWVGMTPGRVRSLAGLRNERRIVAGGARRSRTQPSAPRGPLVLSGGGTDPTLLAKLGGLAKRRPCGSVATAVMIDAGWQTCRPTVEDRDRQVDRLASEAQMPVIDSGLTDRDDAASDDVCRRIANASLIWFTGGDVAAIYDRIWATPALAAVEAAQRSGAIVGGVSAGAILWGEGTISDYASSGEPEPFDLLGWIPGVVVFAHYLPSRETMVRTQLAMFPGCRGLAVAHGGAVVVGPGDRVDILTEATGPTVLFPGPHVQAVPISSPVSLLA